ncbi:hypothetical protein HK105_208731 [Polyrhizophydium stewartii]|uniref:Expansin-like EG45 domain-containing protein n=1 Tax=Polyrhizophydium stewartii TaxID=2732419 RepID=A0ABR4MX16_9FUNG
MLSASLIAASLPLAAAAVYQLPAASSLVSSEWQTGRCTYHPYQEDLARLGSAYDNSPGWCGIRYTALDITRVVAVNGVTAGDCAQCLEFRNAAGGPSEFVLIIDQKGDPGLDISRSSFSAAFPGQNPLDPQTCAWRIVDPSNCAGICRGSALECTPGQRNLLPASQLPPLGSSGNSGGKNSGGNNSGSSGISSSAAIKSSTSASPTSSASATYQAATTMSSGQSTSTQHAASSSQIPSSSFNWPSPEATGSSRGSSDVAPLGVVSGSISHSGPSLLASVAAAVLCSAALLL